MENDLIKMPSLLKQYTEIKKQYKDCILFFMLGDFYEMFYEDAEIAAKVLEITLTKRSFGLGFEKAPLAGVPLKTADIYLAKLIRAGYKVAICDQVSDSSEKGIVQREVTRVVTPGTITEEQILDGNENNYLMSIYEEDNIYDVAFVDISTAKVFYVKIKKSADFSFVYSKIKQLEPKEILLDINADKALLQFIEKNNIQISYVDVNSKNCEEGKIAVSMLMRYLERMVPEILKTLSDPELIKEDDYLSLDGVTIRNLELIETLFDRQKKDSLFGVLNKTVSAHGARVLSQMIKFPLLDKEKIIQRQNIVSFFYEDLLCQNDVRERLKTFYDLERIIVRLQIGTANGRDLLRLLSSFKAIEEIKCILSDHEEFNTFFSKLKTFETEATLIEEAIKDDPPLTIKEGGLIKDGFSKELDALKNEIKDATSYLSNLENKERMRTGIKNLKVKYNKVFGYFIEVSKSNVNNVPEDYIRKQTLVNAERFFTTKLKEVENEVGLANVKINELEYQVFNELKEKIETRSRDIKAAADIIATLDVLVSFSKVALENNYVRPNIIENKILIKGGRHPIVERILDEPFISNDTIIDDEHTLLLITGPNMGGKSTYMKQVALIVIMNQIGSFVPATSAELAIQKSIFTRIGAFDNISKGESTFFVEMKELAHILNNADEHSLVLLDEVGRGTSMRDGLSIAYSASKYLLNKTKTLFATHYHEISEMLDSKEVSHLKTSILKENDKIVLLHKIEEGISENSFGLDVASLAGIKLEVLKEASEIFKTLK